MSRKLKKVDPRVKRTRRLLRNALMELIPEKGYNAITIGEITERATLNRATFYLHYRDKDDLLYQGMQEMLDELTARKPVPVAKDGRLSVAESASAIVRDFEHLAENAEFYRLMLGRHGVAEFRFHLQEYVYDVTAQRLQISLGNLPTGPVQTEIVLNYIATAYIGIFQWWLENDMPYTPEYMASQFIKLYRLGVYQALGLEADIAGAELEN